jgi:uncharacterized protein YciI
MAMRRARLAAATVLALLATLASASEPAPREQAGPAPAAKAAADAKPSPGPKPPDLEHHAIAVLVAVHGADAKMPEALFREHLGYILRLVAEGTIVGGPVSNPADPSWAGLSVFRDAAPAQARAIAEADPAVKAGFFRVEVLDWRIEKGVLAFPRAAAPADGAR